VTLAAVLATMSTPLAGALFPWLDPREIITGSGPWALVVICLIIFAETGLLVGVIFPGDTLLLITGILSFSATLAIPVWIAALGITVAAFVGGEVGYWIGHKAGPRLFERRESGFFSIENVKRTSAFFQRFGPLSVIAARFVPIVRTIAPVLAGVGHMSYRRYTAYNAIGAAIWGFGLTFAGWALVAIAPPLAFFVEEYIDIILIAVVVIAVTPIVIHLVRSRAKAKRAGRRLTTHEEAEALVVDLDPHQP
jgi:membrane-associated protein